jgi:hypothetical protein
MRKQAETPELAPRRDVPPSWPAISAEHLRPRSQRRSDIEKSLAEARLAEAELPKIQEKASQTEKHQKALEEYDRPFNKRKQAAVERAKAAVEKVHQHEAELSRAMAAALEESTWRVAKSLVNIAASRDEMLEACRQAIAVDFDKALQVNAEDDSEATMLRAKSIAAETAGPAKLAALVDSLDPNWQPLRALPAAGPSREVAAIVMSWLWPGERKLSKLDSTK